MLRLLIVDDEPYVVDDLYEFFSGIAHLELDVYKVYSGNDALELLNKAKIDIVLSDISMPDIGGLDLAGEINQKWPKCRVILLTGHSEFEMAYSAIRNNVTSYILKTEGDEEIVKAVEKAAEEINEELKNDRIIDQAAKQIRLAIPVLQQEYVMDLLQGEKITLNEMQKRFKELEIELEPSAPVIMLIGRVDCWPENSTPSTRTQLLYTIQSIAAKYLAAHTRAVPAIYERTKLVWLLQADNRLSEQRRSVLLKDALETIQTACRELLKLSVSFVLSGEPVNWNELDSRFDVLKLILNQGLGFGKEMLLTDSAFSGLGEKLQENQHNDLVHIHARLRKLDFMEIYLEHGQKEELKELLLEVIGMAKEHEHGDYGVTIEVFYSISLMFLSYINKMGISAELALRIDLNRLTRMEEHKLWDEAAGYFLNLIDGIFENRKSNQEKSANDIVNCIKQYIDNHLEGDLSLIELAEQVYLNPSYLSRFYKHVTGRTISDYIAEARLKRAKELLGGSTMKIYEIAALVGYKSAPYFTRYFKKETKKTPQEYRDLEAKDIF